jgi:hypothetical protein
VVTRLSRSNTRKLGSSSVWLEADHHFNYEADALSALNGMKGGYNCASPVVISGVFVAFLPSIWPRPKRPRGRPMLCLRRGHPSWIVVKKWETEATNVLPHRQSSAFGGTLGREVE